MKYINLIITVLLFCSYSCISQKTQHSDSGMQYTDTLVYSLDNVDENPEYEGGIAALMADFAKGNALECASEDDFPGTLLVQFVITSDGTVTDGKIIGKEPSEYKCYDIKTIERFESKEMRKWKPAKKNGMHVSSLYRTRISIHFQFNKQN